MRLVRELLNDVSVDMNMDVTHAESYTHNRQTRRRNRSPKHTLQGNSRENKRKTTKQDKENREAPLAASALVYRVLSRLFEAVDEELTRGAAPLPMSIDEAHYYFPQVGAREDFNKEVAVAVNHWGGLVQSPRPHPRRGNPTHQIATRSEHKTLKHITKYRASPRPKQSRRGMKYIYNTTSTT